MKEKDVPMRPEGLKEIQSKPRISFLGKVGRERKGKERRRGEERRKEKERRAREEETKVI